MSDILSDDGLPGAPKPVGGRLAPYLVVVVVALLSSGVLSTDPEPRTPSGSTTVPAAAPPALLAPGIVGEDPVPSPAPGEQAELVEFKRMCAPASTER